MPSRSEFVEFVIERMAVIGKARARAMFGGHGIYLDERMFAIVVDERLYFKADADTRSDFEAMGLAPFTYVMRGRPTSMQYYEAPPEVFDDAQAMRLWARKAIEAALRKAAAAPTPRPRSARPRTPRQ